MTIKTKDPLQGTNTIIGGGLVHFIMLLVFLSTISKPQYQVDEEHGPDQDSCPADVDRAQKEAEFAYKIIPIYHFVMVIARVLITSLDHWKWSAFVFGFVSILFNLYICQLWLFDKIYKRERATHTEQEFQLWLWIEFAYFYGSFITEMLYIFITTFFPVHMNPTFIVGGRDRSKK